MLGIGDIFGKECRARILATILYMTLVGDMGRKSFGYLGSVTFGIKRLLVFGTDGWKHAVSKKSWMSRVKSSAQYAKTFKHNMPKRFVKTNWETLGQGHLITHTHDYRFDFK